MFRRSLATVDTGQMVNRRRKMGRRKPRCHEGAAPAPRRMEHVRSGAGKPGRARPKSPLFEGKTHSPFSKRKERFSERLQRGLWIFRRARWTYRRTRRLLSMAMGLSFQSRMAQPSAAPASTAMDAFHTHMDAQAAAVITQAGCLITSAPWRVKPVQICWREPKRWPACAHKHHPLRGLSVLPARR